MRSAACGLLDMSGGLPRIEAKSCADERSTSASFLSSADASVLHDRALVPGGAARLRRDELGWEELAAGDAAAQEPTPLPAGWVWAPLGTLDGRTFGSIHAFDSDRPFSELHEAMLVHLAQMASAGIERALLYEGRL